MLRRAALAVLVGTLSRRYLAAAEVVVLAANELLGARLQMPGYVLAFGGLAAGLVGAVAGYARAVLDVTAGDDVVRPLRSAVLAGVRALRTGLEVVGSVLLPQGFVASVDARDSLVQTLLQVGGHVPHLPLPATPDLLVDAKHLQRLHLSLCPVIHEAVVVGDSFPTGGTHKELVVVLRFLPQFLETRLAEYVATAGKLVGLACDKGAYWTEVFGGGFCVCKAVAVPSFFMLHLNCSAYLLCGHL